MNPISTVITKKCYVCGQEKPISEFYRRSTSRDKHMGICKSCLRNYVPLKRQNTKPRKVNKRVSQLAAALHFAQQHGMVDVTACIKAVRSGKWDDFQEVG